jgi:DNA helicase-2/ATP-dependent DNA helicase PcrA
MPDMEQYSMPNWYGLCRACQNKHDYNFTINSNNKKELLEELSVFYVGVTRARKQIVFSASKTRLNSHGNAQNANLSCLLKLPGITLIEE